MGFVFKTEHLWFEEGSDESLVLTVQETSQNNQKRTPHLENFNFYINVPRKLYYLNNDLLILETAEGFVCWERGPRT